jgi:DNA-binding NtrC family response regulator
MPGILLIDGDPVSRKVAAEALASEGYSVDTGASLADARQLGDKKRYSLIVAKLELPDGDGLGLLRWSVEHKGAPVVVLSASGAVISTVNGKEGGVPGSTNYLRWLVRRTLGSASRPMRLREIERTAIEDALRANGGNRTHTARQLGISLRKLQYRLKEYGQAGPG